MFFTEPKWHGPSLVAGIKLSQNPRDPNDDVIVYRQVVGALQYCTLTRPEIAFVVNQLCQFMHSSTYLHLHHNLHFTKGSLQLQAFSDSDWAKDVMNHRSTIGYVVFLGPCLVSWCAKKQSVVSRSNTESEYRDMAFVTAEFSWLYMLLADLQVALPSPPTLWCDNLDALSLAANPVIHARTKHIEVDYHFIREKVVQKDIILRHLSTYVQLADIFTKGLTSSRFNYLRDKLSVRELPISLKGDVKDKDKDPIQICDKKPLEADRVVED